MKKLLLLLIAVCGISATAISSGIITLDGVKYSMDTLYHAKVGPGTTQTSLLLKNQTNPEIQLRAFYFVVDLHNKLVDIRNVVGQDQLPGGETVSSMAKRYSKPGLSYFAGINTDGFYQSGTTPAGEPLAGEPYGCNIVDGEIYKISNNWTQISFDENNEPYLGYMNMTGEVTIGGKKVGSGWVNRHGVFESGITFYSGNRYYKKLDSPDFAGQITEVQAKMVKGDCIKIGEEVEFEITSMPSHTGEIDIPEDGYVLAARESVCRGLMDNLKPGDKVSLKVKVTVNDIERKIMQSCSGNPRILEAGQLVETQNELWTARHPRTGAGYNKEKTEFYMMVIDGRSGISSGATNNELSNLLQHIGAYDAINVDGGGSSTCYTLPLGIRNVPSDGKERAVAAGSFVVSKAPEDHVIASIAFRDWAKILPEYGIYKPVVYGYNQYGVLIDTDVQDFELSCSESAGYIKNKNTYIALGSGTNELTVKYKGIEAKIPVTIDNSGEITTRNKHIINDTYQEYAVELQSMVNEEMLPVSPAVFEWSTSDAAVVDINSTTGVLKGLKNGTATITGTKNGKIVEMTVSVEKPELHIQAADPNMDIATWKVSSAGTKEMKAEAFENGMKLTYLGAGSRSPYIKLTKKLQVWSLPDVLQFRINPGKVGIKNVKISLTAGNGEVYNLDLTTEPLVNNQINELKLATADWCDVKDISNYPITINSISMNLQKGTIGQEYVVEIPGIEAVYDAVPESGVETILSDNANLQVTPNPVTAGESLKIILPESGKAIVEVFDVLGKLVYKTTVQNGSIAISADDLNAGLYLIKTEQNKNVSTAKFIVK